MSNTTPLHAAGKATEEPRVSVEIMDGDTLRVAVANSFKHRAELSSRGYTFDSYGFTRGDDVQGWHSAAAWVRTLPVAHEATAELTWLGEQGWEIEVRGNAAGLLAVLIRQGHERTGKSHTAYHAEMEATLVADPERGMSGPTIRVRFDGFDLSEAAFEHAVDMADHGWEPVGSVYLPGLGPEIRKSAADIEARAASLVRRLRSIWVDDSGRDSGSDRIFVEFDLAAGTARVVRLDELADGSSIRDEAGVLDEPDANNPPAPMPRSWTEAVGSHEAALREEITDDGEIDPWEDAARTEDQDEQIARLADPR